MASVINARQSDKNKSTQEDEEYTKKLVEEEENDVKQTLEEQRLNLTMDQRLQEEEE